MSSTAMRPYRALFVFLVSIGLILISSTALFAQSGNGSLLGRVSDESGAALPGVSVTATNDATGFNRTIVTASDGTYRFQSLPIGVYSLLTDLSGFASVTTKNVEVNVASDRTLNIMLKQAAVKEQITVTAEAPLVATSPSVGTVVSQQELENLPLNGRQFANLGALAPGTTLSVNSDPTKPGQLTIALNGGSGRNVNFVIDGGDNTDDTIGGALQNFNIEAVQEFKIQTMQYKAEFGRSSGGVLSVVTKTGTNQFSGSAYEFRRDKSLNSISKSESDAGIGKQPYSRDQYGVSFGGPIVKDRAHFFGTYEKTKRTTSYTVNTGGLLPSLDGQSFGLPFQDQLGTFKASVDATPKQFLQVRYGYQKNTDKYGASSLSAPSSLGTTANKYSSILGGHTWQVSSDKLNDFIFQYTNFKNLISADSTLPYIYFPSGAHSGQSVNTPQSTLQKKYQYKDDFSWSTDLFHRRNDFKAGVQYVNEPTLGGDFTVGTTGQFTLLNDKVGSPVENILFNGGFSGDSTPVKQYNYYAQDDITVNSRLNLNVGLRYDLWTGFDLNQSLNPNLALLQSAAIQAKYHESYIQDFANGGGTKLKNDRNNWAPRLGFTYDLSNSGKSILRGGIGRYYDFPYTNATILFPASAVQSLFGPVYGFEDPKGIRNPDGSFFQPGQPLPPNQLSGNLSDRTTSRYRDIPFRFRANPIDPTTGKRRFAGVAPSNFRLWYGKGPADYSGANLGFHARLGTKFEAQGFYTYSRAKGNILAGADEFRVVDAGFQPDVLRDTSVNPLNPDCSACNGPLDTDARHRITLSTVYHAPYGINASGILRYHSALPYTVFAGTDLNGDGYNEDLAPGHTHVNDARGASFSQMDIRISKEFRFSGQYGVELIGEVFNLFNSRNPAIFDSTGTAHAFAGDPGQGEQRLAQLGLRVKF